jgi:uncharacterized protein GlcG (DUF336 family)
MALPFQEARTLADNARAHALQIGKALSIAVVDSPSTVRRAGELLPAARVEIVPGAPHSMY